MSLKATQIYNLAVWHLEQIDKASNDRDRNRHAQLADRLFILAHWATKFNSKYEAKSRTRDMEDIPETRVFHTLPAKAKS